MKPYYQDKYSTIYQGDCLEVLQQLPDQIVNCVMTSPPYWALRDYGIDGQLGLEPTFQEYITKLCNIFDEVKRVLRKDGNCWVNLGDSYLGSGQGGGDTGVSKERYNKELLHYKTDSIKRPSQNYNNQSKCLAQIPSRFSLEMTNKGWMLRNKIIWHKRNCMPASVTDRFTVDFEEIFFFVKNKKYWFEQQFDKTLTIDSVVRDRDKTKLNNTPGRSRMMGLKTNNYAYRNKRTVWTINPKPFKKAHSAVYPEELCVTPIKAGCPKGGIVLDPFMGSGTTGVAAKKLGRKFIGIELNQKYIDEISISRLKNTQTSMF